jgi:DNA-binding beta-propeller fold protein YncE
MERRFTLPVLAAVSLAALTGLGMAQQTGAPGTITIVAGTDQAGFSGDGGPATQARLRFPWGVAVDPAGSAFIAEVDSSRVRKVSADGMISTVARIGAAESLAFDQAGNLFISSHAPRGVFMSNRVDKLSPEGLLTTVAGTGKAGFSGDGGPALQATIDWAAGIAVDAAGNLFIVDANNHRVRKVSRDGIITTVAGSGPSGFGQGQSTGDGGLATEARLMGPHGLALDRSGNLYIAEAGSPFGPFGYRVRKVSAAGIISTVAGSDAPGFSGDGGPATQAHLNTPLGLAVDTAGNLFIADWNNYRVRKVDANGIITTVAGIGNQRSVGDVALATATGLRGPLGLAVDRFGNLLIADSSTAHGGVGERVFKVFGVAAPGLIGGEPFPSP